MTMDRRSQDDNPQSSGSAISGLSLLESETDDFGRQMLEHARRDRERMHEAAHGQVRAFSKARPQNRVALTAKNLERHGAFTGGGTLESGQLSLSGSDRSPQPHVPRRWGSKGKQKNDFLSGINTPNDLNNMNGPADALIASERDHKEEERESSSYYLDVENAAVGISSSASHENAHGQSKVHRPRHDLNDSLERIYELEQEPIESPTASALRRRRSSENSVQREIEDVSRRAVATSTLDKLGGKSPRHDNLLRRARTLSHSGETSKPQIAEDADQQTIEAEIDAAKSALVAVKSSNIPRILEGNNEPVGLQNQHVNTNRVGKRDLLRALSRSTNATPSPSGIKDDKTEHKYPSPQRKENLLKADRHAYIEQVADRSWAPSALTPKPTHNYLGSKTPVVTGAWIETPVPLRLVDDEKPLPVESEAKFTSQVASASNPPSMNIDKISPPKRALHAKSALEAIIQEAKSVPNYESGALGEDTVNSLQEIIEDTTVYPSILDLDDLDEDTLDLINGVREPNNSAERQRQLEGQALQRMTERLHAAKLGMREVRRGITRIEHQVEGVDRCDHLKEERCTRCGCPSSGLTLSTLLWNAWKWFKQQFYEWPKWNKLRLTWLGLVCLLLLAWSLSEVILCEYYCHQFYAVTMRGYGVDIHAPRMPWVTTTILLKRPFAWLWRPLWRFGFWIVESLWSSFSSDIPTVSMTDPGKMPPPTLGTDMRFSQDEYI